MQRISRDYGAPALALPACVIARLRAPPFFTTWPGVCGRSLTAAERKAKREILGSFWEEVVGWFDRADGTRNMD